MDSRYFKRILTVFITMVLILSNSINIFASNDFMNKEDDYIDMICTSDILGDEKADETIEIHRKEGNKVNTIIKEPTTMQNDKYEIALVEGGNMDAINPLATKQNIAKADMTENVGEAGKNFEIFLGEDENGEGTVKQTRQFVTFTTKSGKTFHLIIDHEKASQNVSLLTDRKSTRLNSSH